MLLYAIIDYSEELLDGKCMYNIEHSKSSGVMKYVIPMAIYTYTIHIHYTYSYQVTCKSSRYEQSAVPNA